MDRHTPFCSKKSAQCSINIQYWQLLCLIFIKIWTLWRWSIFVRCANFEPRQPAHLSALADTIRTCFNVWDWTKIYTIGKNLAISWSKLLKNEGHNLVSGNWWGSKSFGHQAAADSRSVRLSYASKHTLSEHIKYTFTCSVVFFSCHVLLQSTLSGIETTFYICSVCLSRPS